MTRLNFFKALTDTELPLAYASEGVRAGFPSPAQDYLSDTIDLNKTLINHPAATFYARVEGDSMEGEGIDEGDILVVDRSLTAENGDLAVCCLNGEFTLKRLEISPERRIRLMPSNPRYRPIVVGHDDDFRVWGVVTYTIKSNRRRHR